MKVVTLNSKKLAPTVAQKLKVECRELSYFPFEDGEGKYVFDEDLKNEEIIFIQSLYPDQFSLLVKTCFAIDFLLNQKKAGCVTTIIPYLPFQRQDKPLPNESRNAEAALKILSSCGVEKLYTVDPHSEIILKKYPFYRGSLDPSYCIGNYLSRRFRNPLIVAPDYNAKRKASIIAKILSSEYVGLNKKRDEKGRVYFDDSSIKNLESMAKGEECAIIVDDVVSGGSTLIPIAKALKSSGVKDVYAVVTHVLLNESNERRLFESGIKEIISTDSIENKFSKISLADLIVSLFRS
jgi:ribose-phosphate pyrophosphokinase